MLLVIIIDQNSRFNQTPISRFLKLILMESFRIHFLTPIFLRITILQYFLIRCIIVIIFEIILSFFTFYLISLDFTTYRQQASTD